MNSAALFAILVRGPERGTGVGSTTESRRETSAERVSRRERFGRLLDPNMESVVRLAHHLTPTRERADDAVQETLLRAWKYFDSYDGERSGRVWLLTILRNVVIESAQRRGRDPARASLDAAGSERAVSREPAPEDRLIARDVHDAIGRLPATLREIVLLCVIEQLKYREAAEALHIPVGTVMSRLHRARMILQWHLRDYADESALPPEAASSSDDADVA